MKVTLSLHKNVKIEMQMNYTIQSIKQSADCVQI